MIIYLLLILLIFSQGIILSSILGRKGDQLFLLLSFIEILFVAGFRKSVGGDSDVYLHLFTMLHDMPYLQAISYGFEKGFLTFCWGLARLSRNPQILIFASTFVITALVFRYIYKNSICIWFSVFLYMTLLYFFNFMNLMRFGLAITILLQSIQYIEKKQLLKFIICVAIACTFHFSAFIFIFAYSFGIIRITRLKAFIVIVFLGLSTYFLIEIVGIIITIYPRYASYRLSFSGFQGNLANYIIFGIYFVLIMFSFLYEDAFKHKTVGGIWERETNINLWLLTFGVGISLAAIKIFILTRYSIMFTIICIIYIPNLITKLNNRNNFYIISVCLVLLSLQYTIVVLTYRPDWFLVTPYKNSLFH